MKTNAQRLLGLFKAFDKKQWQFKSERGLGQNAEQKMSKTKNATTKNVEFFQVIF